MSINNLILDLFQKDCIKIGKFNLKNGTVSPIYIDLKNIISYPSLLNTITDLIWEKMKTLDYDCISGIPYGAIPVASILSANKNIPMILVRKEKKNYGTSKQIEGLVIKNNVCVLIEDVITTGSSIQKVVKLLNKKLIIINDVFVICDRRNYNNINNSDYKIHSLFNIYDIIECLISNSLINYNDYILIKNFVAKNDSKQLTFTSRAQLCTNNLARKVFLLMEEKKTNLCFSADLDNFDDLVKYIKIVGPHICILKLHSDIVKDLDLNKLQVINKLSIHYKFFIIEDRKFSDIGNTFKNQYQNGPLKIKDNTDMITAHGIAGEGVVKTFSDINIDKSKGLLLVYEMSSKNNLISSDYKNSLMKYVVNYTQDIIGLITQKRDIGPDNILYMTPGVSIKDKNDNSDQKYRTPEDAILRDNCDIIIVGRGIYNSDNVSKTVEIYKFLGWKAYKNKTLST